MPRLSRRTPEEVFEDHLCLAQERRFEEDVKRNFAEDCVVLTARGVFRGHAGVRALYRALEQEVRGGAFRYETRMVDGRTALLEWKVDKGPTRVDDGVDSFVIEGGVIKVQTIHYTVRDEHGPVRIHPDGTPARPAGPEHRG